MVGRGLAPAEFYIGGANMAKIIDGKLISSKIKESVKQEIEALKSKGVNPALAVILVGQDPASMVYVNNKEKTCNALGIESKVYRLDENTTTKDLLDLIDKLNKDDKIHGILLQHPVPYQIDEKLAFNTILPKKDVDGFNNINVGKLSNNEKDAFVPCTPLGVLEMLKHEGIEIEGKHCVIVGRSSIVGKPMAKLMLNENATVTVCHSKTKNLAEITKLADILICTVGKPEFITANMVKEGAVVIDVGINRVDGKLVGDVKFDEVSKVAEYITPVPGGVGPMTIAMLMKNTVVACQRQ